MSKFKLPTASECNHARGIAAIFAQTNPPDDMSASLWPPKVQPAQLSFIGIYNPGLSNSDETFEDQVVFWYSRRAIEARATAKKSGRNDADVAREDENEKLRQIGLAQGMVDFARSFSAGQPVDSIETEKSRIVLHELEQGWWILASVDLTRLPSITPSSAEPVKKGVEKAESKSSFEYSSREVSPAALLAAQLLQAHRIFLLHHGPSLSDLFVRVSREKFCSALDRFWTRFARTWDVLLHGNPATDVFSGLKLASGGELGFGVGEEEWGSGEREVLEDLAHRTEGLVDLVVSRFGEPAKAEASDETYLPDSEALPWMGSGSQPAAADGVVFGGIGAISRPSLRDMSLWARQIYTYGEYAYGVRDNPTRERRKRRRRNPIPMEQTNGSAVEPSRSDDVDPSNLRQTVQRRAAVEQDANLESTDLDESAAAMPEDLRPRIHDETASQDHAAESAQHTPQLPTTDRPSIPPPIVTAADDALEKATQQADQDLKRESEADAVAGGSTWGVPDQYMKYLTFGLSELGKPSKAQRPSAPVRDSSASLQNARRKKVKAPPQLARRSRTGDEDEDAPMMTHLDPMPDQESVKAKFAAQRRQENRGHFVIGLKGDLDEVPDDDDAALTDGSLYNDLGGSRTVLRTIQVELTHKYKEGVEDDEDIEEPAQRAGETSNSDARNVQRVRVLVYVHRPFIYCFLFENRTSSLSYPSFYKELHTNLVPIHKPLLSSTNVTKVAQRIEASHAEPIEETASVRSMRSVTSNMLPSKGGPATSETRPIFDLIHDPRLLTVHTSIPNIPEPGTPAAEGFGSGLNKQQDGLPAGWTRVDALNVHGQLLNTLQSVNGKTNELERTSKTSRGWWVVWMRVPPSTSTSTAEQDELDALQTPGAMASSKATLNAEDNTRTVTTHIMSINPRKPPDMHRVAFLVRKSSDPAVSGAKASAGSTVASGMWSTLTLRPALGGLGGGPSEEEKTGGAGAGWGPSALTGEIGIDARRYVEGLLSLNR